MSEPIPTYNVLGTDLSALDYKRLGDRILSAARSPVALNVDFANTQIVTLRRHDPAFARLTKDTDLFLPDGMPLVWVMNLLGAGLSDRVYGPTFTKHFLESCPGNVSHYLVGGSEECGQRFRANLVATNPALRFVGGYHGTCSPIGEFEDDERVINELRSLRPTFVWVGLGTPKQYHWIARARACGVESIILAVGFAFDVIAGTKPDAPAWMQRHGMTWLFRLASEPTRLGPRYLKYNSLFIWYLAVDFFRQRLGKSR